MLDRLKLSLLQFNSWWLACPGSGNFKHSQARPGQINHQRAFTENGALELRECKNLISEENIPDS